MVHVSGAGHPDSRMQQEHAVDAGRGPLGQLLVDPVQRVTGLESDHVPPAGVSQHLAGLEGCHPQLAEVVVLRQGQHLEASR